MSAFDSDRKLAFLENYKANGLRLRRACREMGLSEATVSHHLRIDPVFKEKFDAVEHDYIEDLESVSKSNALNPKSVIERIFLLKCLLPDKYGQENKPSNQQIIINIDGKLLSKFSEREKVIDAKIVDDLRKVELQSHNNTQANNESVDTQHNASENK
jgi:outer membrane protein assembly factor BamE (lipoprotein component of BamABCDE complex)